MLPVYGGKQTANFNEIVVEWHIKGRASDELRAKLAGNGFSLVEEAF